jgi:AbrB family looped-hinge helix DNA binding protein
MPRSTITSKGQTTIPKVVRDRLRLKAGDRIEFVLKDDGTAVVVPITFRVADLVGILPKPARPLSIEQIRETIRKRGGRL